jgi:hypothetical protein
VEAIALTPEDRAILELESDTVAGHTCKVIVVGEGAPGLTALRAGIEARIEAAPALTLRLSEGPGLPAWVPDDAFEVGAHVVAGEAKGPLDDAGLRREVSRLFALHLDRQRPLWRIDALPLQGDRLALIWRLHHAVADGTTAMRYAEALLWDAEAGSAPRAAGATAAHAVADQERRHGHLAGFIEREFARSRQRSPFDAAIGRRRRVEFASVPLDELHTAAKALGGATVNDAVLTVVAGGLRRWVEAHHGSLGAVRVKVPVSLHHEGDDAGNRDSFFTLAVPLNEADPVARLAAVHAATAARKEAGDAEAMDELLQGLGRVSPRLERFCDRLERSPRRFALNVSNVPGPREPVSVDGAAVESVHSLAEIGERHALRVAVVSIAGQLCFGFCADPGVVDDLAALAQGVELEAAALVSAAGEGGAG